MAHHVVAEQATHQATAPGTLYIVSTPIGNLADLSHRAVAVLGEVRTILAEDTRHSRTLLAHYAITTPLHSYHEHNEAQESPRAVARLAAGESLALISDAGTPLLSDPGARLVQAAERAGVTRFVLMSSIKVNGEITHGAPFTESTAPQPQDAYGLTKCEAEELVRASSLDATILRPPLVYGPGVKANFLRLLDGVARRMPLPLAAIDNRRSLIYVKNLAHAITTSLEQPTAMGKTFLVRDTEQPSTPELIRRMGVALGRAPRLFACPPWLLAAGATIAGRTDEWRRLSTSLEIDSSAIQQTLAWTPPHTLDQGLSATAEWYHRESPIKSNT